MPALTRAPFRFRFRAVLSPMAVVLALASATFAADSLALNGAISADGRQLTLEWAPARGGSVQVFRRPWGAAGPDTWQQIQPQEANGFRMVDGTIRPGRAYEYQIRLDRPARTGRGPSAIGYWLAGTEVPARADEGTVLLVVDETLADALAGPLERFQADLVGAGWQVVRHLGPRGDAKDPAETLRQAAELRGWIADRYHADPAGRLAVILLGHLPVVHSGWVSPDGHGKHAVPSDLYYADSDGLWLPTQSPEGRPQLLPGQLTRPVPMQIGRIDFAGLSPDFGTETGLLAAYLDRNHRWRHAEMGDRRRAYGASRHLQVERDGLRNIVGPGNIRQAGHHDGAGDGPYLLGVDFGHWNGKDYPGLPRSRAVFAINFGSGKHRFDADDNAMRALLAQKGDVLAVGWGGRPAWHLHAMALGDSIGTVHLRTVNNGLTAEGVGPPDYAAMGNYRWAAPVWINLLGDPTLRPFPLAPVVDVRAEPAPGGVRLSWTLPPDADGARVFRAEQPGGPWHPLADGLPIPGGDTIDPAPAGAGWYMIRAEGLARVHAGSFRRLSQGIVVQAPR